MNRGRLLRSIALFLLASGLAIAFAATRVRSPDGDRTSRVARGSPEFLHGWEALALAGRRVGASDAPVTIVVAQDMQCAACATAHSVLERVAAEAEGHVSLVFLHNPLSVHPFALQAAIALECASREVGFASINRTMFRLQDSIGLKPWEDFAAAAGVADRTVFRSCLRDSAIRDLVETQRRVAQDFGLTVTPSIVVNGWLYRGVVERVELKRIVAAVREGGRPPGVATLFATARSPLEDSHDRVPLLRLTEAMLEAAPRLRVAPVPSVIVRGDTTGEFDVDDAGDFMMLGDTRVVTFSLTSSRLLVFSLGGGEPRAIGRAGGGPGERERVANAVAGRGDTIVMMDAAKRSLLRIAARSGQTRSVRLPEGLSERAALVVGEFPDGSVLVRDAGRLPPPATDRSTLTSDSIGVHLVSPHGTHVPIGQLRDGVSYAVDATWFGRSRLESESLRLGPRAKVVLWDTLIVMTESDSMWFRVADRTGRVVAYLSLALDPRRVDQAMREQFTRVEIEQQTAGAERAPEEHRHEMARLIRSARYATHLPSVEDMFVGADRALWIVAGIAPTDRSWCAFGVRFDGTLVGRVCGGVDGRPVAFGRGTVLTKVVDADGLTSLELRRLLPEG